MRLVNVIGLVVTLIASAARAQFPPPAVTPPDVTPAGLNVVAANGIELVAPNHACRDLGRIDLLNARVLDERFTLRNDTKSPLVIERVQPTCGCTSAILGAPTADGSHRLAPNETVDLDVSIDPSHLNAGPIDKFVNLFVKGSPNVAATIELTGRVTDPITFSSNRIDLGHAKYGRGATASLSVRVALGMKSFLGVDLISDNPDVTVSGLSPPIVDAEGDTFLYEVHLAPNAGIGFVHANLMFDSKKYASRAKADPRIGALLDARQTVVIGEVSGSFDLTPRIVLFGTVSAGTRAVKKIAISGKIDLAALSITCDRPFVSATVSNSQLNVGIAANAPVGPVEAHLTLSLPSGEHMTLPVYGYVTK